MADLHMVWMDMEMTGLDPKADTILEIATIITDKALNIIAEGPNLAIRHPKHALDAMDAWCQEHHSASGLCDRVLASKTSLRQAEDLTLAFIRQHVAKRASPLCGNSIHQDRRFLVRYMPELEAYLHYRNIDVSSIKELVHRWYPELPKPVKRGKHLARDDILESIEELRYYQTHVFKPRSSSA